MSLCARLQARLNRLSHKRKLEKLVLNANEVLDPGKALTIRFRDGQTFECRDADSARYIMNEIFIRGEYDVPELKEARVCVDVGSNIGLFAKRVQTVSSQIEQIYCFEADPANFAILSRNLGSSPIVTLEHVAVGPDQGLVDFYSSHNAGWSSLYRTLGAENGQVVSVPMVCLSTYLREAGVSRIDLMKIDIEGGEYGVLLGDAGLQDVQIACLLVEVDQEPRSGVRYTHDELVDSLKRRFKRVEVRRGGRYPLYYCRE